VKAFLTCKFEPQKATHGTGQRPCWPKMVSPEKLFKQWSLTPRIYIYYILYIIYILSTNWFSMGFNVLTIKNSDRGSHRSRGSRAVKVYQ
jgi:hypothetical protein